MKMEQFPATNPNPMLNVANDGVIIYSNEAGEPLLHEWGMRVRERLPSRIVDLVQRVIFRNSPEKIEVKAGNKVYLVVFHPIPKEQYVNVSAFDITEDITERKRTEKELVAAHSLIQSIIDSTPDIIYAFDLEERFLLANRAVANVLNSIPDLMIGKRRHEFMPKIDADWHEANDRKVFEENRILEFEEYSHLEDRSITWLTKKFPIRDHQGKIYAVAGISADITERKLAEEALQKSRDELEVRTEELEEAYNSLKESEERLAEAQRMAHIGNWVLDVVTGETYGSDEMYRIFGLNPQESTPTYGELLDHVHSDDREFVDNAFQKGLNGDTFGIDYRIILDDRRERIVHTQIEVVFDEKNNLVRIKGTVQDITERKRAEEKLLESEEKYRNIVETANEGIGLIDNELKLTFVNKKIEDMIGFSTEEIIGRTMWDFISEESKPIAKSILERGLQDFENPELKYIRKDGSPFWAQVNAKPIFDNEGKFIGIMTMLTDITKRKEAEETLKKMEIARKQEIHHRIKNNLQVISSLLDLQAEKFRGKKNVSDSQILEALKESQDRVISMALIHEELYKGRKLDTLNFSNYVQDLADNLLLTYGIGNNGIILDTDIEEDIFFDMDTSVPLGIIINELLSNSLKYAFVDRDKGEIQIKLYRKESEGCEGNKSTTFVLSVADNGVGIPEDLDIEDLDSLGLQLVTTLVDQLEGELELKRNNGTEFIIKFTVLEKNDQPSSPISQQLFE